jgi:ribosome biogenesis GTPase
LTFTDLTSLGWDEYFSTRFDELQNGHLRPARITRVDRGACDLLSSDGPLRAALAPDMAKVVAHDPERAPCVGDWAAVGGADGRDRPALLMHLLERRTAFRRTGVTPGTSRAQVLAANVDLAVIVEPLRPDPDLGRLERLLALAWESGALPIIALTKSDLVSDSAEVRVDVAAAAPGVGVHAVSSLDTASLEPVRALLTKGRTLALLGPSGAGKSTLTNALAGRELMVTRELRADAKGRHTTSHRELFVMPGGGLVIDTPGLRSVGLTADVDGLSRVFDDIEALAALCRFHDCGHRHEPGCAVHAAVESGDLAERRLASWHKLQREVSWMARRQDARLQSEERDRWKRIHLEVRRSGRIRP